MTYRAALNESVRTLEGTETPFLDAVVLMAHASHQTKERLLSSLDDGADEEHLTRFFELTGRRASGTPVSYLIGRKEFWGLDFYVDNRVLVPRPDTEILVEAAIAIIDSSHADTLLDCCTGSGCVALSIVHERKGVQVSVSDLSDAALSVFEINRAALGLSIAGCYRSDLFTDVPGTFDIIAANPPYLGSGEVGEMTDRGWPEPSDALLGGSKGVELPIRLIHESLESLNKDGYLIMEAASHQMPTLETEMRSAGFTQIRILQDLGGRDRVIAATTGADPWLV